MRTTLSGFVWQGFPEMVTANKSLLLKKNDILVLEGIAFAR